MTCSPREDSDQTWKSRTHPYLKLILTRMIILGIFAAFKIYEPSLQHILHFAYRQSFDIITCHEKIKCAGDWALFFFLLFFFFFFFIFLLPNLQILAHFASHSDRKLSISPLIHNINIFIFFHFNLLKCFVSRLSTFNCEGRGCG